MTLHVIPINDLIAHDTTTDCVCIPQDQHVTRDDGSSRWLTIHHALDGREHAETTPGVCPPTPTN